MQETGRRVAYIDGANLHKGVSSLGWKLDYRRFRVWLKDKYGITDAYLFIGLIPEFVDLYVDLRKAGYVLIFKEVVYDSDGRVKGNCDADLVLRAVRDAFESRIETAVLVSGDGDYAPLILFWCEKGIACKIVVPSPRKKCSWLLRKTNVPLICLADMRSKVSLA